MGISVTQLLIILAIVIVLFGTKRLRSLGTDLGGAIKGFRSAVKEGSEDPAISQSDDNAPDQEKKVESDEKIDQ